MRAPFAFVGPSEMSIAIVRKYWKTGAMAAATTAGDNPLFVLDYLLRFLRVVMLLSVWRAVFAGRGAVGGMELDCVLTYTLISSAFGQFVSFGTSLPNELWNGAVTMRFLRPMRVFGQCIAESLGGRAVNFALFSIPLLAIAPLLGVHAAPAGAIAGLTFFVSLALAVAIASAIELMFSSLVVLLENGEYSVNLVRSAIVTLLSGALLPLRLLPWGVGSVLEYLPFASMASAPLSIYTGVGSAGRLIMLQAAWVIVLWPLAAWAWRSQRERLVTYGG